ncbi:uncharacterized protein Z520_00695 [Fonsecaea multimorphosa CBS 102226]|uniref:Cation/H+ exchanger transmembrane domain-containing protein n=1 Tax=Fonsecaea multimorphosa CBS 102226 TaxID=1442371 RepID=A0A0D2KCZ8_9EURO|nr:uncharacterized protein Z520_00695 [Fonsecaea multimorphosa CBS 102226]KIY04003.1 hypothetical protein Z520_00695 [Fonsecaea multimorphosa CBS 102226]OAL31841.1 hypothetical protein AYO22_00711 [Fonsecaea multimorphosa]
MADAALPYHEPGIITILIQSSFLLVLNTLGFALDRVFYCGLVGQVLIGMAWGAPGLRLLARPFEDVAVQLGHLGLIAIVFEGGLATSVKSLGRSMILSICVALTGICLPMALSFSLMAMSNATKLQAFAAGAAPCSTSLGTTFSLFKTTNLTTSRLGTILTSAAMLDDVAGLIMVQIITNLGSGPTSISATMIMRPVCVPCFRHRPTGGLQALALLATVVTAASYAGTSNLFAAYMAGPTVSWIDEASVRAAGGLSRKKCSQMRKLQKHTVSEASNVRSVHSGTARNARDIPESSGEKPQVHHPFLIQSSRLSCELTPPPEDPESATNVDQDAGSADIPDALDVESRSLQMYNHYYAPTVERILKPFFFASIGFSIPITKMFRGPVIWRGLVYATLMAIGKLFCGMWLVRISNSSPPAPRPARPPQPATSDERRATDTQERKKKNKATPALRNSLPRPKSLYLASILGCAMVARDEIGFLISALAATNGIFTRIKGAAADGDRDGDGLVVSDLYLIVTWAILLCTLVGPLALGVLAKRVRRLQDEEVRDGDSGLGTKEDPWGIWGVN